MNEALPISNFTRLEAVLAHVRSFPAPVRPIAVMTGVHERDLCDLINPQLYKIVDGYIQRVSTTDLLARINIGDAARLYQLAGVAAYIKDGQPAWLHVDEFRERNPTPDVTGETSKQLMDKCKEKGMYTAELLTGRSFPDNLKNL